MTEDQKPRTEKQDLPNNDDELTDALNDLDLTEAVLESGEVLPVLPLRGTVVLPLTSD